MKTVTTLRTDGTERYEYFGTHEELHDLLCKGGKEGGAYVFKIDEQTGEWFKGWFDDEKYISAWSMNCRSFGVTRGGEKWNFTD